MVPTSRTKIIRKALSPYPSDLVIVTKVSTRRGPAFSREELTTAVHGNLRNLGLDVLDVVNPRAMFDIHCTRRRIDRSTLHSTGRAQPKKG